MRIKFLALALSMFAACHFASASQREFFVAPSGVDSNPGTQKQPFKTLERARDAVRMVNKNMDSDINVYFGTGNYTISQPIEFDQRDSGTKGHRIYYQADSNQQPVFNGGVEVTGWTKHDGAIYKATLNSPNKLRSLIVNGKRVYMASKKVTARGGWGTYKITAGQADWARISATKEDGVKYDLAEVPMLKNPEDVEIIRNTTWNSTIVCVREVITEGAHRILQLQQPYGAIALNQGWGAGFTLDGDHTICNAYEFLDQPGEFYFNRKTKTLYYYSEGEDMSKAQVYAPIAGSLLTLKGASRKERVCNISFRGITFTNSEAILPQVDGSSGIATVQTSTWCYAFDHSDWHRNVYRAYDTAPCAITVSSANSIDFQDNTFIHISNDGIGYINDASNSNFIGNLCSDIGGSAVIVGHPQHVYEGDVAPNELYTPAVEGICKNIVIKNNVFYDMTRLFIGHTGITAFFVEGIRIENNHIQGAHYSAVSLGWGWNEFDAISVPNNPTTTCKNNSFSRNRVYDCMQTLHDGGAFYTLGNQPDSLANGNYVKAFTTHFQGVYHPDEGTAGYTGKDLVFEIVPGQDNFELNDYKRKRDNHFKNVYSTSTSQQLGAPNCTVDDLHVYPNANWPDEALAIIRAAGPEPEYHHLLKSIPKVVFSPERRYDVDLQGELIKGDRYEAELAELSGGAKVESNHLGFSGNGFVAGYHNNGLATTSFMVNAPKEATYKIKIRYAAGFGSSKLLGFYVNTEKVKVLECAGTMGWSAWATHSESVKLMAGMNAIVLKAESATGAPVNIDFIEILK